MKWNWFSKKKCNQIEKDNVQLRKEVDLAKDFLQQLKSGQLQAADSTLQAFQSDLQHHLLEFKEHLSTIANEENQRNWTNEGLAKFAMLLRSDASDLAAFYHVLLANTVKYLNANQGMLFLLNDDQEDNLYLESVACYAYDKRKYINKRVEIGEGLVGQAYLEQDIIFMTDVPDRYVQITSGLGHATARCLLVVPIMLNEKVYGVIELATFDPFKPFEVDFIKKLAENFASVISSTKTNIRTRMLLETSQLQSESLRAQEEELRQNMEELSSIQEDITRQLEESNRLKSELAERESVFNETTILSETDPFGTITFVNDKFCQVAKYRREELIGQPQKIVRHDDMPKEIFKLMWDTIKQGKVFKGIVKNRAKDGSHYWVDATIVPILDQQGNIVKYIGARYHIPQDHLAEMLYAEQLKRLGLNAIPTQVSLYH